MLAGQAGRRPIDPDLDRVHGRGRYARDFESWVSLSPPTPLLRERACRLLGRACIALGFGGFAGLLVTLIASTALHDEGRDNGSAFGWGGVAGGSTWLLVCILACCMQQGDECGPEAAAEG